MYRRFRVSLKAQSKIKFWFAVVLSVLMVLWFIMSAVDLQLSLAILEYNNEQVDSDNTKVKIEHIGADGDLHLSNTDTVDGSKVTEYIKVSPGKGTYYIPDKYMSTEITKKEGVRLGLRFILLDWFMVLLCLYWGVWRRLYRGSAIGYGCVFLVDLVVLRGFVVYACSSPFPVSWLCLGRLCAVFGVLWVMRRVRLRVGGGSVGSS